MMIGLYVAAQKKYTVSTDDKTGFYVFKGPITFPDIMNEKSFTWFNESLQEYKPDYSDLRFLTDRISNYDMVIFMGTWCDDSHYLIPKLYALLKKLNYPIAKIPMYGVDRDKSTGGNEKERYKITKVPTIILYREGSEIGRITESVAQSIEHDLSDIITQDKQ
jgi:thiol-disulfide isomerase/thioredoxin